MNSGMNPIGFLIAALGVFALAGSVNCWRWFWRSGRARTVIDVFGPAGARTFYFLVGIFLIVTGLYVVIIDM